jgi:predicted nucleic acid-binding Zn ribbon protein
MPIYCFDCECGVTGVEKLMSMGAENPPCPRCGKTMRKLPTFPAMVKWNGDGGYPSRRKFTHGTAPFTTNATKVWGEHDPSDKSINYMGTK